MRNRFLLSLLLFLGIACTAPAQKSKVLFFNSPTSKVVIPHADDFNFAGDFTIEAWIYLLDHPSSFNTIIEKSDFVWGLYVTKEGNPQAWITTPQSNGEITPSAVLLNKWEWIHLAAMYDAKSGIYRLFVNGKSKGAVQIKPVEPVATSNGELIIGGATSGTGSFRGYIDEVRISRSIRYANDSDPRNSFTNDTNTVALYHFDEGSGSTAADASGKNHTATLTDVGWASYPVSTSTDALPFAGGMDLSQNYPNPFRTRTFIPLDLREGELSTATLKVYDQLGRQVADLTGQLRAGLNNIILDGTGLPSNGHYYYQLRSGSAVMTRRLLLAR